jgi:hypothetical protein
MKATLEFDLDDYEDEMKHKRAVNSTNAYIVLSQIANEIFRPHRKHGYHGEIQEKLDKCGSATDENGFEIGNGEEVISLLEDKFYSILVEHDINLSDLE